MSDIGYKITCAQRLDQVTFDQMRKHVLLQSPVIKTSCVYQFVRWVQGLAPDISCVLLKCKQIQQQKL